MQTRLADWALEADYGREADGILRRCTHCGFCLATCPTFQITGDELDSPRGRIYQMKLVLEGEAPTRETQLHLDRCLTCNNCETTCPSGVEYGALVDIGRQVVGGRTRRSWRERLLRTGARRLLTSRWFGILYKVARGLRPVLPGILKSRITRPRPAGALPPGNRRHARQVLLLANCVQPAMLPSVDAATIRVLDALDIGAHCAPGSGCCGAINFHMDAQANARDQMRRNVDAWLPLLESGEAEAVVVNVSGCGAVIKDYARHLQHDPAYADRALRLMPYVKDIAEFLAPMATDIRARMRRAPPGHCAFHPPCSLQHWMRLRETTEHLLRELGFDLQPFAESHLCCGSAGTYSITQPEFANQLRDRKLEAIRATMPAMIVSANVGCICHLQSGTQIPVRHWIEVVDSLIGSDPTNPQA